MNELDLENKDVSITFLTTRKMDKEMKEMLKKKKWRKSAFIRVCIQKELDRIKNEK